MNKLLTICLLLIISYSCDSDDQVQIKTLRFDGTISNGDTGQSMSEVKVKLKFNGIDRITRSPITEWDSATTDNSGNYSFIKKFDRTKISYWSYSIIPVKEFYENCVGLGGIIPVDIVFERQIDTLNVNLDTKKICQTGQIKLIAAKLEPSMKDTLFFKQTIKTSTFDITTSKEYSTLPLSEIYFKFFTQKALSVDFAFTIKKESGLITNFNQSVVLQSGTTKELKIDY